MASELIARNQHLLTLHPEYQKNFQLISELHRAEICQLSWSEILERVPNALYESKDHAYLPVDESLKWFEQWCEFQKIPIERFALECHEIVNKLRPKINTLLLFGPPNSGKTLIANTIAESLVYYGNIQSMNGNNTFEFQEAKMRRALLMNEPMTTDATVNTLKNIMEGQNTTIAIKYRTDQILLRTPVIMTSNNKLAECTLSRTTNEAALMARCIRYDVKVMHALAKCEGKLHPGIWKEIYCKYINV